MVLVKWVEQQKATHRDWPTTSIINTNAKSTMRVQNKQHESGRILKSLQAPQWSQDVPIITTSDQLICPLTKCQRNILRDGKPQLAASVLEAMCHWFTPMAVSATARNDMIL